MYLTAGIWNFALEAIEMALSDIQKRAEEILKSDKFPLLLGGEHLVTLAAVRAMLRNIRIYISSILMHMQI